MSLEELIGKKLVIGIPGASVSREAVDLFRETHAAGLIVYRHNFSSAQGFKRFIADLEEALGRKLLVAVDHEGGRVIHLAEGVTVFPDNLALGHTGNETYAAQQGEIEARELRRLGIDLNLAPTLDVLTETYSPNIGIRSYSKDPDRVARLGAARIRAMQAQGLAACAKHFPGQGHSPLDAHLALPVLPASWEEMKKIHLKPFEAAIRAGVEAVMSSHPVYPGLDPTPRCPATFSRRIIWDCLRKEMGFQGLILSDDLEMGALKDICPIGEAACRAVEAGHDMLLICHSAQAQREVFQSLLSAYREKRLDRAELEASVVRVEMLRDRRSVRFADEDPTAEPEGEPLAREIARKGIRISRNDSDFTLPLSPGASLSLAVIFPRLSELKTQVFVEPEMEDEEGFVQKIFSGQGCRLQGAEFVGLNPGESEIQRACVSAGSADLCIFFCYDAHLHPRARKLLDSIQSAARRCVVILLRDPYDEEYVKRGVPWIQTFGFRAVQIQAAVERIIKRV